MHTVVLVSAHAAKNGSQYPRWMVGRPRWYGQLAEAHRPHAARRVASHLGGGQLGVPQRDEAERDQAATGVAAPLLDHPVVVGLHARQTELLVLALEERLAAEPREGREAHRRLDPAGVHVGEACLRVVAAGAHVVVGDRRERHLLSRVPDGRDHALVRVDEVLVHPAVDLGRRVVVEVLDVDSRCRRSRCRAMPRRTIFGPRSRNFGGQPRVPHVRRLDDVVVDADDLRDSRFVHGVSPRSSSRPVVDGGCARRVSSASTVAMSCPVAWASAFTCSQSASDARAASALSFHRGIGGRR